MRLFLLPISARRALIYCQKQPVANLGKPSIVDRLSQKAAITWADWEKKEKGWQRTLTDYGNKGLQRIPYEEWGLRSIPYLSAKKKQEILDGKENSQIAFPGNVVPQASVLKLLQTSATTRSGIHRSRLIYCVIGMPITIPFMLIPVIPNIPFFYLLYRAWAHWQALAGSWTLQFLLEKNLIQPTSSKLLEDIYKGPWESTTTLKGEEVVPKKPDQDFMLLTNETSRQVAKELDVPELAVELERAVWQVSKTIEEEGQKIDEVQNAPSGKEKIDEGQSPSGDKTKDGR